MSGYFVKRNEANGTETYLAMHPTSLEPVYWSNNWADFELLAFIADKPTAQAIAFNEGTTRKRCKALPASACKNKAA